MTNEKEQTIKAGVEALMHVRGLDTFNPDTKDTPARFLAAMLELTSGYEMQPGPILGTVFTSEFDQLILLKDIDFISVCAHHLLPFHGVAHVGYVPRAGKVVGLSKLARIVDCFARRFQMQETITEEVAGAIFYHLNPLGVGVVLQAEHSCLSCRGARKQNARMITSKMLGVLLDNSSARAEFLKLAGV